MLKRACVVAFLAGCQSAVACSSMSGMATCEPLIAPPDPNLCKHIVWPLPQQKKNLPKITLDGIDIETPDGSEVAAADGGVVSYAGDKIGYGQMIIIDHPNGYFTVYAHNSVLKVALKDRVKRGQIIALSGHDDHVATPRLHFELRKGWHPVNPVKCFKKRG
jgi:murein DD-endopeptidase MepM/ murein hydrolase activator NlpD